MALPPSPPAATVSPLAGADKGGTRETRVLTPLGRDERKAEDEAEGGGDSDNGDIADVGGGNVDADSNANTDVNANADANADANDIKDDADVSVGGGSGGDGGSDEEEPSSHWACRSCSTFNSSSLLFCSSCATPIAKKGGQDGKPDWWCCKQCSRFNNRYQDGATCRLCSAPEGEGGEKEEEVQEQQADEDEDDGMRDNDEEEEEEGMGDEEMISIGGGELMPSMAIAAGSVQRLAPALPPA
ncbi:unnamed protein product [Laminaria digitata]